MSRSLSCIDLVVKKNIGSNPIVMAVACVPKIALRQYAGGSILGEDIQLAFVIQTMIKSHHLILIESAALENFSA
jgi:hypothetical protein